MADGVNFIPQIDYTSRDYLSIREDLLNVIPLYAPQWTNRDPSDFGMTMVELFSYMGDLLNFYIDRAANEGFLATASQRESILQIAGMLNYRPTASAPARVQLTFTNTSAADATIPAGTQLATTTIVDGTSTQIIFETDAAVTVPAKSGSVNGTANVDATQGYTVAAEQLGVSTGGPNQIFRLSQEPVIGDSIRVYVNGIQYQYSTYLIESTIYDPVFTTVNDAEGYTYVVFGDGVGGRIPPAAGVITADYRVGAGKTGNVPSGKINYFLTNPVPGVTVVNQEEAYGGADEESTDSIRTNAPLALRSLNRAVSLKDYANLALQIPSVQKSVADGETFSNITLYVAPFGDSGVTTTGTSEIFDDLAQKVIDFFLDKTAPNVTLTVLPPTYVPVDVDVKINLLPQYKQSIVTNQTLAALREILSLDNTFFADVIPMQYVLSALTEVPGISYAEVTYLRRSDDEQRYYITEWKRTGNIVTFDLTSFSSTFDLTVGQKIIVSGVSANNVDGTYLISSIGTKSDPGGVTLATVSVVNVGPDVSADLPTGIPDLSKPASTPGLILAADATNIGLMRAAFTDTITCAVNEIPSEGTITITALGGIA